MNPLSMPSTVTQTNGAKPLADVGPAKKEGAEGFGNLLKGFVENTNADQVAADTAISDLVTGRTSDVQGVVMAVANAEMSFQLFMEIRNKLLESYNDLMRMQF